MYAKKTLIHFHEFSNYILIELRVIELQIFESFCSLSIIPPSNLGGILLLECMSLIVGSRISERYILNLGVNFGS